MEILFQTAYNRHPIPHPCVRGMGCFFIVSFMPHHRSTSVTIIFYVIWLGSNSGLWGSFCVCQWQMMLQCNTISHCMDAYTKRSLSLHGYSKLATCRLYKWGRTGGSGPPTPRVQPPLPPPKIFLPTPAPFFPYFFWGGTPPKIPIFCPRPCPSDPRPFFVKSPPIPDPLTPRPPTPLSSTTYKKE